MIILRFIAAACLAMSFSVGFASEATGKNVLTLREAISTISKTSPEIKESIQVYESVKSELDIAKSGYNPTVAAYLAGGKEVTDGVDTDYKKMDLNASKASVSLKQNIFNGFGTREHVRETEARVMAAAYDVLNTANKVFLAASESYVAVLQEKELLDTAYENVTVQAQILNQIEEKTKSGFGKKSDLTSAQARMALSRANYISQQQTLKQAIVNFHRQMGRFLKADEFDMPEQTFQLPESVDKMVDIAFYVYPAINVADYNVIAKKYGKKRKEAGYYPTIDFELKAARNTNTGGDEGSTNIYSAMASLNYNIYDGGLTTAERKVKQAEILKEYERSFIERRNLIQTVRLAWAIKESEDAKLPYLKEYVELTGKTRDAFIEENKLGRRTLLELLNMENEYQTSKTALIKSKYNSVLAYFRLLQVTGIFLSEYENELAKKVGLPDNFRLDKLADYAKLDDNRDKDAVKDFNDQCQESFIFSTSPYGCESTDEITVGYTPPAVIEPYLKPQEDSLDLVPAPAAGSLEAITAQDTLSALPVPAAKPAPKPAAELKPLQADAPEEKTDLSGKLIDTSKKTQKLVFPGLTFKYNSYELTDEALAIVLKLARELREINGKYYVIIYGHTDNTGTPETNRALSKLRVLSVHQKLLELGVPRSVMYGLGKGDTLPLYSNDTVEGRVKNRRIEFKIIMK